MADIHKDDIGTDLVVAVVDEGGAVIDVSAAPTLTIYLKKPGHSGAVLTKTAVVDTTGTDGLIRYNTVSGDLSASGNWTIQGYVVLSTGEHWHTAESTFFVAPNLA